MNAVAASTICVATSFSVTSRQKTISRKDAKIAKKNLPEPGDHYTRLRSSKELEIQFRHWTAKR